MANDRFLTSNAQVSERTMPKLHSTSQSAEINIKSTPTYFVSQPAIKVDAVIEINSFESIVNSFGCHLQCRMEESVFVISSERYVAVWHALDYKLISNMSLYGVLFNLQLKSACRFRS